MMILHFPFGGRWTCSLEGMIYGWSMSNKDLKRKHVEMLLSKFNTKQRITLEKKNFTEHFKAAIVP